MTITRKSARAQRLRQRIRRHRANCEALETRQLMAADVAASVDIDPQIQDAFTALYEDARDGTVELSGIGLGPVTLDNATVTPASGTVTGNFTIDTGQGDSIQADVLVQCLDDCVLGLQIGDDNLAELLPLGDFEDQVDIKSPIIAYRSGDTGVFRSQDLPAPAYDFWSQIYRDEQFTVRVHNGLNVMTAATLQPGSAIAGVLAGAGITAPELQLEGVLLETFESNEMSEPESQRDLWDRIREDWTVRATLDGFGLDLPAGFVTGDAYLELTGTPSIAVGFGLEVPEPDGDVLNFDVKGQLSFEDEGPPEVRFVGHMEGAWDEPLGIEGLDLNSGTIVLSFDPATQAIGFGLAGDMQIGSKQVSLAGKLELNVYTGAPVRAMFKGELDSLTDDDIVAFVNGIGSIGGRELMDSDSLPDFELRNLGISIAPLGGDADLGIEDGLGLEGELYVSGTLIGFVDGQVDAYSDEPSMSLKAWADELQLGELRLDDPRADVAVDTARPDESHFIISGVAELMGSTTTVDVNFNPDSMYFHVTQTVDGLYLADFEYRSPIAGNPVWSFTAEVRNEMGEEVERLIAGKINAAGESAQQAVDVAQAGVARAQAEVNKLDGQLREARRDAQQEYDKVSKDLSAAQSAVNYAEGRVASWSRTVNSRYRSWRSAVSATNRAPWYKKPYYKSIEAGRYSSYRAAQTQRAAALVTLRGAREALKVVQAASGWALDAAGPDAHPNVIQLKTRLTAANTALATARAVLNAAEDAADAAANFKFDAFMVDRIYFHGVLVDYERAIREGNVDALDDAKFDFQVDYRWMGERERFRIFASTEGFGPDLLVDALADLLPV